MWLICWRVCARSLRILTIVIKSKGKRIDDAFQDWLPCLAGCGGGAGRLGCADCGEHAVAVVPASPLAAFGLESVEAELKDGEV